MSYLKTYKHLLFSINEENDSWQSVFGLLAVDSLKVNLIYQIYNDAFFILLVLLNTF